jgi:hypothetical protein
MPKMTPGVAAEIIVVPRQQRIRFLDWTILGGFMGVLVDLLVLGSCLGCSMVKL